MWKETVNPGILAVSLLVLAFIPGCPWHSEGQPPKTWTVPGDMISDYAGPATVYEDDIVSFTGKYFPFYGRSRGGGGMIPGPGTRYTWTCDPIEAGDFFADGGRTVEFHASKVDSSTAAKITVVSDGLHYGPDTHVWDIMILNSPDPKGWGKVWQGIPPTDSNQVTAGMVIDKSNNLYVIGTFEGATDFDPDPLKSTVPDEAAGMFLSRFDSNGTFKWVTTWERDFANNDPEPPDEDFGLCLDSSGNIYATHDLSLRETGSNPPLGKSVLRKFDPTGTILWKREYPVTVKCIAARPSGGVVIAGEYREKLELTTAPSHSDSIYGVFLTLLDPDGNEIWTKVLTENASIKKVAVDRSNNIYLLSNNFARTGGENPGLNKFDPDGKFLWFDEIPRECEQMCLDSDDNVIIAGTFGFSPADFDPSRGTFMLTPSSEHDFYLLKLDSEGWFKWATNWAGGGYNERIKLAIDQAGDIFFSCSFQGKNVNHFVEGRYQDDVDLDPSALAELHNSADGDVFLTRFDPSGIRAWTRTWKNISWSVYFGQYATAAKTDGTVYLTGTFNQYIDFDPGVTADMWLDLPAILNPSYSSSPNPNHAFLLMLPSSGEYR